MSVRRLLVLTFLASGLCSAPFFSLEQRSGGPGVLDSMPFTGQGPLKVSATVRCAPRSLTGVGVERGPAFPGCGGIALITARFSPVEVPALAGPERCEAPRLTYWAMAPPRA